MRAGRMLAQGDLRLLALALIAEAPRHGYEIIKLVEEKTADWYSPSPGIIYPTLTYLEEAGYVTAATEGSKKLYTITETAAPISRRTAIWSMWCSNASTALGERVNRWRRRFGGDREDRGDMPPLVEAAFEHLRGIIRQRLESGAETEASIAETLAGAAADLQRK